MSPAFLSEILASLGEDPVVVLRSENIRGQTGEACGCPIARFVKSRAGNVHATSANSNRVVIYPSAFEVPVHVQTPEPVKRFILDFDGGRYPDLVEDPA